MNIELKRKKLRFGFIYGMVAGAAFAVFTWGIDAFLLYRANALYSWIRFIPGLVACILSGGVAGWLTIRIDRHASAFILWGLLAVFYSWLVTWMSFRGTSEMISILDPNLAHYFDFNEVKDLYQISLTSFAVIALAAILCGLLEINLVQQASVASHGSAILTSLLVCILFFAVVGSAVDKMINTNTREPVQVVDKLIQFAADNQGKEVPRTTARKMHLSAVDQLGSLVQKDRTLILIGYDQSLGLMDILVNFEGTLAKCTTIYAQPTDCIIITSNQ